MMSLSRAGRGVNGKGHGCPTCRCGVRRLPHCRTALDFVLDARSRARQNPEMTRGQPPTTRAMPFLLLPGMAADVRLFAPQMRCFPHLRVPAWIDPQPDEPLRHYAA